MSPVTTLYEIRCIAPAMQRSSQEGGREGCPRSFATTHHLPQLSPVADQCIGMQSLTLKPNRSFETSHVNTKRKLADVVEPV